MPPIPDTGWTTPTEFPNLSGAKAIAIDTETFDPELRKRGPGWARGVGHIVGISVAVPEGNSWYFPIRHEVEPEYNLDPDKVLLWAKDNLTNPSQPKLGAKITYDVGWLREEGVRVQGKLHDVQFAEALLREALKVNLDSLGERYLGRGKETSLLYDWCAAYYGGKPTDRQRENIYRSPPRLAGPYAEEDASMLFPILDRQWPLLAEQGLLDIFDMENRLIYLMIEMRYAGVTIDIDQTVRMKEKLEKDLVSIDRQIKDVVGFPVNPNAPTDMAAAFNELGLKPGITKKGLKCKGCDKCPHLSFAKPVLEAINHPFVDLVKKRRAREKLVGTFLQSYLLDSHINGKVYGQFHQLRGEDYGARSGRYSSSNPNLQNIPIRSKLGKELRKCFIPDGGHARWIKADYSQVEYRGLAHYAVGDGAEDVRRKYRTDPDVDFHVLVQTIIREVAGRELDRPLVKNVNFGITYGMSERKLGQYINLPAGQAKELFAAIHGAAPFLKATMEATMREAEELGYITTITGRRSRFDLWVPKKYDADATPLPYELAIRRYGRIERAHKHKALNRRLQGSAADLLKMAMLKCWEGGMFDEPGVPRLTVHDELDFSDPGGADHVYKEIYRTMEHAIRFNIPIKVGVEVGPSWGDVKEIELQEAA